MMIELEDSQIVFLAVAACFAKSAITQDIQGSLTDLSVMRAGITLGAYGVEDMYGAAQILADAVGKIRDSIAGGTGDDDAAFPLPMGATPRNPIKE